MLVATAFMSCQDQVEQVTGNYSYKISGSALIDSDTVLLADEMGAMQLIRLNQDSALLTFNALLGSVYTAQANIDGKTIEILPYETTVTHLTHTYWITAQGKGDIYDNTIIVTLRYADKDGHLKADKMTMVCKKD